MKMRQKLFLFLTAALILTSGSAMAFDNLLLPITNTFSAVKMELWANGVDTAQAELGAGQSDQKGEASMPEEVTLGLEKWQSSL